MGRKINIEKINNATRRQVTYSKRRVGLLKKAEELATYCDVDVALVAFSPSGRISKFCSRKRMEEVLHRYINLPPLKRYEKTSDLKNIGSKLERLKQLDHLTTDENKLLYLSKHIELLELEIKKSVVDLEILDANLKDFEPTAKEEQDPSLAQVLLCEENLQRSLQRVIDRKKVLLTIPSPNGQLNAQRNLQRPYPPPPIPYWRKPNRSNQFPPSHDQRIRELDPWLSPYRSRSRTLGNVTRGVSRSGLRNIYPSNLPRAYFPSTSSGYPFRTPPFQTPATYYAPMQLMRSDHITPNFPNRQQAVMGNLSMGMREHGMPSVVFQPHPTQPQAPSHQWKYGASTSQFQANPSDQMNWINSGISYNSTNDWDLTLPPNTERTSSLTISEPLFTATTNVIAPVFSTSNDNINNNIISTECGADANGTHPSGPIEEDPLQDFALDSISLSDLFDDIDNVDNNINNGNTQCGADMNDTLQSGPIAENPPPESAFDLVSFGNLFDEIDNVCSNYGNNNYQCGTDMNDTVQSGPIDENPLPGSSLELVSAGGLFDEVDGTFAREGNQEDGSIDWPGYLDWDGLVLEEDLTIEDCEKIIN